MSHRDDTLEAVRRSVAEVAAPRAALRAAMQALAERHAHYEWVGIYVLRGDELDLEAFVGQATEHVAIPVGKGVCGTAVARRANQLVTDVRDLDNYIACSESVRSEIVVLIWHQGEIVGQIDADCDAVGAFDAGDEALLSRVAEILGPVVAGLL
ncbi:MAG: GAF domain-containing protein [Fibrobacter sp.]|nr:GAF domain-containing protein [Fibrobacter sp.]